jgi:hypothetical protein
MNPLQRIAWMETIAAFLFLVFLVASPARAEDRKIIWRVVTTWTVIGGPAGLPARYKRGNGDFATRPECLKELELSQDRLEADRAETEQNARKAGAGDVQFKMTSECAPRYADTTSEPFQ